MIDDYIYILALTTCIGIFGSVACILEFFVQKWELKNEL